MCRRGSIGCRIRGGTSTVGKSFQDVAVALAAVLAGDEFDRGTLAALIRDALNFPVPIVKLDDQPERGRAVSRTDVRLQGFRRAHARAADVDSVARRARRRSTVLVATSGDTGSAVAQAFFGVAGTRVVVLYPEGQVSDVQEAQFTTLGGNVTAVAVRGTFDDCQRLAKEAFADRALQSRVRLTSANSISLGRLLPQMFYYAYAALQSARTAADDLRAERQLRQSRRRRHGVATGRADRGVLRADDDQRHGAALPRIGPRRAEAVGADARQRDGRRQPEQPRASAVVVWRRCWRDAVADHVDRAHRPRSARRDRGAARAVRLRRRSAYRHRVSRHRQAADSARHCFLATAHPAKFREVVEPAIGKTVPLPARWPQTLARKKTVQRIGAAMNELSKLL